jgi:UDP-N-acetylmuramoyl-tripeptide--D-alanyl-D-alanine ligase
MKSFFKKIVVQLLRWEARLALRKYHPSIIAITGSVGKTSAKDAIYSVISSRAYARKSQKSFNSEVGLPLTVLGRPNAWSNPLRWIENLIDGLFLIIVKTRYPEWLVLEVGADRPGDIKSVAKWLPVNIAVITRLPEVPVHVEFFDSPEQVVEEKASLIGALTAHGTLVLYADDENVRALGDRAQGKKVVYFGFSPQADARAQDIGILFEEGAHARPIGMKATLIVAGESAPIQMVGALGAHAFLPVIVAAAVGNVLGKSLPEIIAALATYVPPPGRMHLLPGIKDTTIVDDTYNSSPAAATAALDALASLKKGRKIAVLGDMLELGRYSAIEHKKLGAYAAKNADIVLTVGLRARDIAEAALDAGMKEGNILQYDDARRAGEELQNMIKAGDVILIKGSQGMRLERVVQELMQEPERAAELLVRQDEEWKKR